MKNIISLLTVIALVLALSAGAFAEPSDAVKGIFDALVASDSAYSAMKASYLEYTPDMTFEETLDDDGFTIAADGSEYLSGSWKFTEDGDALTASFAADDFYGVMMANYVVAAVGAYYGMNTELINSYVNGLDALGIQSDNFSASQNDETGGVDVRINIAGAWDMSELDEMVIDENSIYGGALDQDYGSVTASMGKLRMVVNGNVDDATMLLGEYGELDDLAYQSIVNAVSVLQPTGWEAFVADFTELKDVEADGYSVKLNADEAAVAEIIDDANPDFSYAILHFGA